MRLIQGPNRAVTTDGGGTARIICRRGAMLLAALALPGCAGEVWEKPGATEAEFRSMKRECDARAYAEHPPLLRAEPRLVSGFKCVDSGRVCFPSYTTEYRTRDVYEGWRMQARRVCYASNGWRQKD